MKMSKKMEFTVMIGIELKSSIMLDLFIVFNGKKKIDVVSLK